MPHNHPPFTDHPSASASANANASDQEAMRNRPHQTPFSNASEQLHHQYFAINPTTGEYRQVFPVAQYSSVHQGPTTPPGQSYSRSDAGPHIHRPLLPGPAPVPVAVGLVSAAVVPGAAPAAGIHYNLPTDPAGQLIAARRPHPQHLNHHLQLHHLRPQPLPQLHRRHQQHLHPFHNQQQLRQSFSGPLMTMEDPNEHDMAAQQEAAKGYQPALDGPMVGDKTPIAAIADEYAKADPVYVEKTMALPQTYVQYRPVKGDGNCGWRAIGFSYFEKLVEGGDPDQVEGEVARLMSMNPLLGSVGGYDYYEDWADEAIGLLRELADCVTDKTKARNLIHERWTDIGTGSSLIYYLRLLAATYLKVNSDQYDPFVPDGQGIQSYCGQSIELPDREIEQLGIIALVNCLLLPVNFVLEIAYLDRSPGTTVNVYRFPEEANGKDITTLGPIIYLLYRPDHYDILYRRESGLPASSDPAPITMQINRATNVYSHTPISSTHNSLGAYSTADFGLLASLPSAPGPALSGLSTPSSAYASSCSPFGADRQWMPPFPNARDGTNSATPSVEAVAAPTPRPQPAAVALPATPEAECNIRFSTMQYSYDQDKESHPERPFNVTTTTFKNSVWNRAHFGNPEFRPEQWTPEDEAMDNRTGVRRKKMSKEE